MKILIKWVFTCLLTRRWAKNDKGFSYPVTLCILTLFTLLLSFQFTQLVMNKRFYEEVAQYEKNSYYFLLALQETEKRLQGTGDEYEKTGVIVYEDGSVSYNIVEAGKDLLQITYRLYLPSRAEVDGLGYYDKQLKKMVNWFEKG